MKATFQTVELPVYVKPEGTKEAVRMGTEEPPSQPQPGVWLVHNVEGLNGTCEEGDGMCMLNLSSGARALVDLPLDEARQRLRLAIAQANKK